MYEVAPPIERVEVSKRTSIPNLGLDSLVVDLDGTGRKFDTDGRFGLEVELITGEPREQVGFTDTRVSDKDD
ncbi:hypothetical protein BC936DRAFT_149651 [Jimgerdemannia flammicorona]|uniref:Uncharacterized protein n=2 Tax=Jimgerdemannia flammicorona TaxID=994334 RepID=A0A433D0F0_9FUNG|nr:hypothetical protein BC936DRAFT_149651 [Jimgerdemannia flammicorona]RUS26376.1 hypothetical protein BC938DRAFT_470857 [Jimgerdemannia flammicorona]